ncbi:hypothetical protein FHS82_002948 [Pseudochelatococcus lubricantis]|uniref:Antibiotic biosynthesis monooxygenase n=2 Tax=Pseudochelatococcus lubricantis TaxID=1538102 RepID=A0ABX0V1T1_9HYPH|nr:hypothetical protein [Pseudochelatococcus lubricantis]NIJ59093.1 hypothetical protein [Pseudochelatococcus lubricantis]
MIVETTNYHAQEEKVEAVLAQRRAACAIRRELGLDPGVIHVRLEGDGPVVRWQCAFASREAYDDDMRVRGGSPAFRSAREAMHRLIERFERTLYLVDGEQDGPETQAGRAAAPGRSLP